MSAIAEKNKLIRSAAKLYSQTEAQKNGYTKKQRKEIYERSYARMVRMLNEVTTNHG